MFLDLVVTSMIVFATGMIGLILISLNLSLKIFGPDPGKRICYTGIVFVMMMNLSWIFFIVVCILKVCGIF